MSDTVIEGRLEGVMAVGGCEMFFVRGSVELLCCDETRTEQPWRARRVRAMKERDGGCLLVEDQKRRKTTTGRCNSGGLWTARRRAIQRSCILQEFCRPPGSRRGREVLRTRHVASDCWTGGRTLGAKCKAQ